MLYNHKTYNVGIYLRISKDDGDKEESESITNQRKIIYEYLNKNKDLDIYKEYIDDGYSGANFNRPAFKELLQDIYNRNVNYVITKNLARFGRNYIESGEYLEKIFPDKQVRFYAILDNYDNFLERVENDFLPLKSVFNEKHCKDTSVSVKKSKRKRMAEGLYACTTPPFGYAKDPDNNMHLIIDPETSKIVKKIFELKASGKTIREIVTYLNNKKVKTPGLYNGSKLFINTKNVEIWKANSISRILSNEVYLGKCIRGKTQKISYKSNKCIYPKYDELVITNNTHETIISEELFFSVHNPNKYHRMQRKSGNEYLLKELLYCSKCGNRMYITLRGKKPMIHCDRNIQTELICNNSSRLSYEWLESEVINKIKQFISFYINNEVIDELLIRSVEEKIKNYLNRKKIIEDDMKKITQKIYSMYNDKLNEKNTEEYMNRYSLLNAQRKQKKNELKEIEELIEAERDIITSEKNKAVRIEQIKNILDNSIDSENIGELIKRIEINNKSVFIKYSFSSANREYSVIELHNEKES